MLTHSVFFPEYGAEHQTDKGAAVEDLPEEGHGEVEDRSLEPHGDELGSGVFKQKSGDEAHHRTHDADDHEGDGQSDKHGPVLRRHKAESQFVGQLVHNEKLQDEGDGPHDDHFVEGHEKDRCGHPADV